jgi:hypothetical protein
MEPMKPLEPMKPMEPMKPASPWWPAEFDDPSVSGAQNGARYAWFAELKRLLIERDGQVETYDTADHRITGAAQGEAGDGQLKFATADGELDLATLRRI